MILIKHILTDRLSRVFVFFGLFFILFSAVFYLVFGATARESLIEQSINRERVVVRAGANSISSFLFLYGRSIATLSGTDLSQGSLEAFVGGWVDNFPIGGVVLMDKSGKVEANANRLGMPDLGADLSDRDYFIWAKTAKGGEYFVSRPVVSRVGASEGKYVVVVASPVFLNGVFDGVLGSSVILPELTDEYLDSLKTFQNTRVYLVNSDGVLLVAPQKEMIGLNYIEYLERDAFLGSGETAKIFKEVLLEREEGTLRIALPNQVLGGGVLEQFLVAYAPVKASENEYWTLVVAVPVDDALSLVAPFYTREIMVMTVGFLILLAISIRLAKSAGFWEARHKEESQN